MMIRFDRAILRAVLAVSVTLAACGAPSAEDGQQNLLDTSADSDHLNPAAQPKVARLYFGSDETVHLTARSPAARYVFTARRGGTLRIVADGDAPVNLVLYGKDPNDAAWRTIATAYSLHNPTIIDTPTEERAYRLNVTAADIGDFSLSLGCEGSDVRKCATARQPNEICSDHARTSAVMTCEEGLFCNLVRRTCGQGDQGGRCLRVPHDCPSVLMPVCGCDGETYVNECRAQAAGVSTWREGDCRNNPRPWEE